MLNKSISMSSKTEKIPNRVLNDQKLQSEKVPLVN